MPPAPYKHVGKLQYIDSGRVLESEPDEVSIMQDQLLASASYLANYSFRDSNVGVRELADHAPINYVYALTPLNQEP